MLLREVAARRRLPLAPPRHPEPLAALRYSDELALKQESLAAFWQAERLPVRPEPILPALQPRGYRTTTKRRAAYRGGTPYLLFAGGSVAAARRVARGPYLADSALDLPEHQAAYAFLLERLARVHTRHLAGVLNWLIIRGTPGRLAVILNLRRFDAVIVRLAKQLGEALREAPLGVQAGYLYLDPTQSEYYFEARRPDSAVTFKRLFGPSHLQAEVGDLRLGFPPTVFSQVNSAMLETMTRTAESLLPPLGGHRLLDLYCGYGLFSLTVGRAAREVLGLDSDRAAIAAARENAVRTGMGEKTRFSARRIEEKALRRLPRDSGGRPDDPEMVLLDPPRQGTAPGVIRALAARAPGQVLHLCCGTDEIPREIAAWAEAGYRLRRAVPLDLFAGTESLETMLLLTPDPHQRFPVGGRTREGA